MNYLNPTSLATLAKTQPKTLVVIKFRKGCANPEQVMLDECREIIEAHEALAHIQQVEQESDLYTDSAWLA